MTTTSYLARLAGSAALAFAIGTGPALANGGADHSDDGGQHGEGGEHMDGDQQMNGGGHHGEGGQHMKGDGHHGGEGRQGERSQDGDDGHAEAGDGHHAGGFSFGAPGEPAEIDRTVTVTAENFAFNHDEIPVAQGETVRFVVRNQGNMRHDFTIGPAEVQKQHRQEMREMMGQDGMDHSDPNAVMLEPGESAELIWRFEDVQSVMFGCNVPGHFDRMNGQFTPQG